MSPRMVYAPQREADCRFGEPECLLGDRHEAKLAEAFDALSEFECVVLGAAPTCARLDLTLF